MLRNPLSPAKTGQTGLSFFQTFLPAVINLGFVIALVAFLLMLTMGGIRWISGGNDKQAAEAARHQVVNAVVGLVILFSVYAIVNFISAFFANTPLLNLTIDPLIK